MQYTTDISYKLFVFFPSAFPSNGVQDCGALVFWKGQAGLQDKRCGDSFMAICERSTPAELAPGEQNYCVCMRVYVVCVYLCVCLCVSCVCLFVCNVCVCVCLWKGGGIDIRY